MRVQIWSPRLRVFKFLKLYLAPPSDERNSTDINTCHINVTGDGAYASPLPKITRPTYPALGVIAGLRPGGIAFVITLSPTPGKYLMGRRCVNTAPRRYTTAVRNEAQSVPSESVLWK
ncbi:hypothetical protein EVAR_65897_1 [Eumeta japonica]|uniref:Uncharacterized protein n=1 Tax=Eumeta variegata TaxID=151549 RepID=A0A4C2A6B4_EUMVA|nr:hypothetical protein EVAR_65897_1 [Eumeta japonica]